MSLIVSPFLAGAPMHYFGRWQGAPDKLVSPLATFWGGALFALGMSDSLLMLTSTL